MKFGFRKPSLKRSISAMTTGALKREIMRGIIPGYGKRGMGMANPKKAVYNHLYNMVTANPIDLLTHTTPSINARNAPQITEMEYQIKETAIIKRKEGLEQCNVILELFQYVTKGEITDDYLSKALNRLFGYTNKYIEQGVYCGFDFCSNAEERLMGLTRINPNVKQIALEILVYIKNGMTAQDIIQLLNQDTKVSLD